MGVYDFVCGVQVKCTKSPSFREYKIGAKVDLPNGVYFGYKGWFSIKGEKVIDAGKNAYDKWGHKLLVGEIIEGGNPVSKVEKIEI